MLTGRLYLLLLGFTACDHSVWCRRVHCHISVLDVGHYTLLADVRSREPKCLDRAYFVALVAHKLLDRQLGHAGWAWAILDRIGTASAVLTVAAYIVTSRARLVWLLRHNNNLLAALVALSPRATTGLGWYGSRHCDRHQPLGPRSYYVAATAYILLAPRSSLLATAAPNAIVGVRCRRYKWITLCTQYHDLGSIDGCVLLAGAFTVHRGGWCGHSHSEQ